MKIIGGGLPRTGNTSLAEFLRRSGLSVVQYAPGSSPVHWWQYTETADAIIDFPMMIVFPWLMELYPECKLIVTVRSPAEDTLRSLNRHCANILRCGDAEECSRLLHVMRCIYGTTSPTVQELQQAQLRITDAADRYVRSGRAILLDAACPENVQILTEFLELQFPCTEYPCVGRIVE